MGNEWKVAVFSLETTVEIARVTLSLSLRVYCNSIWTNISIDQSEFFDSGVKQIRSSISSGNIHLVIQSGRFTSENSNEFEWRGCHCASRIRLRSKKFIEKESERHLHVIVQSYILSHRILHTYWEVRYLKNQKYFFGGGANIFTNTDAKHSSNKKTCIFLKASHKSNCILCN